MSHFKNLRSFDCFIQSNLAVIADIKGASFFSNLTILIIKFLKCYKESTERMVFHLKVVFVVIMHNIQKCLIYNLTNSATVVFNSRSN